jgi:hypothetical protein
MPSRDDFAIQYRIANLQLLGYGVGEIGKAFHLIAAPRDEPTPAISYIGKRPEAVVFQFINPIGVLE